MVPGNPRLGTQVFKIDPNRLRFRCCHRLLKCNRNLAGKSFNDKFGRINEVGIVTPCDDFHTLHGLRVYIVDDGGNENLKSNQVIDDQPHAHSMFIAELPRQSPRDTDIAEVIDDTAENIAGQ